MRGPRAVGRDRERGATLPIVALLLPVLILMTAFAVDLGRQRSSRRTMQARADIVALDLVRLTGSGSWNAIISAPTYSAYLASSAARNDVEVSKLTVEWGTWSQGSGFQACTVLANCNGAGSIPTAVRVTARETTDYFFQPGSGRVARAAVAATDQLAGFQIGTNLASVSSQQSTLLNALLGRILNNGVNLTAVGYGGLLGGAIALGPLATQLGFASPDALADATVNARGFYLAAAQVMQNQGNTAAATALSSIAAQTQSNLVLNMANLVDIEQGGDAAAANAGVNLYSLVTGSVFAINGTSTISIPSLAVTVPNVTSTTMSLNVTQRPQIKFGRVGAHVTTAQISLTLTPTVSAPISVLGLTGATVTGTIPVTATVAGGTGTLTGIDCGQPSINVGLTPQPVTVSSAVHLTVNANVILLGNVPVARIDVPTASVAATGTSNGASFLHTSQFLPPVGSGTMVAAPSTSIGLASAVNVAAGNVTALGVIAVPVPALLSAVNPLVDTVLASLDDLVVNQLNDLLGLNIGGADIGALDMSCAAVKLVA